jgi:hypothetical protein
MFDRDTGQVFKEYVLPTPPPAYISGRDWSRRTERPGWKGRSGEGMKGPRSLVEISMHAVAENVGFLSEDHFSRRGVSVKLLRRIWTLLENRYGPFHEFKLGLLSDHDAEAHAYRDGKSSQRSCWKRRIKMLPSTSTGFAIIFAGQPKSSRTTRDRWSRPRSTSFLTSTSVASAPSIPMN